MSRDQRAPRLCACGCGQRPRGWAAQYVAGHRPPRPIAERLWARVAKGEPDECWPWLGHCRPGGHGQIGIGRKGSGLVGAHRVAWESANGRPVPEGLLVRHACDNPPCCNPAHLLLGTVADNAHDAVERGLVAHEFRLPHTRISDQDVQYIRENYLRVGGRSNAKELGEQFGVTANHICAIARGSERKRA